MSLFGGNKEKIKQTQHSECSNELPSTPKKKPTHRQIDQTTSNKLKFKYTIIQKPHTSKLGYLLTILFVLLLLAVTYSSYNEKLKILELNSNDEWMKCREDYERNKCQRGLKATLKYCEEKKKCFDGSVDDIFQQKLSITYIAGEILKDFIDGMGLIVTGMGILLIWLLVRKGSGKEVRKEYLEYYD